MKTMNGDMTRILSLIGWSLIALLLVFASAATSAWVLWKLLL